MLPIKISIKYDSKLKQITGKDNEDAIVNSGITFVEMLFFIFSSHPEIEKNYPPGSLALTLNGLRPQEHDELKDGDVIGISVYLGKIKN